MLVKIDEPHMYNADDAVARVDSYIVSVTGGGRFVGERKLVRIEQVERAAAVASLPGARRSNGAERRGERLRARIRAPRAVAVAAAGAVAGVQRASQGSKDE